MATITASIIKIYLIARSIFSMQLLIKCMFLAALYTPNGRSSGTTDAAGTAGSSVETDSLEETTSSVGSSSGVESRSIIKNGSVVETDSVGETGSVVETDSVVETCSIVKTDSFVGSGTVLLPSPSTPIVLNRSYGFRTPPSAVSKIKIGKIIHGVRFSSNPLTLEI